MSMTLAGFGVVFLGFGFTMLLLGFFGLHYGSRESMGGAGAGVAAPAGRATGGSRWTGSDQPDL